MTRRSQTIHSAALGLGGRWLSVLLLSLASQACSHEPSTALVKDAARPLPKSVAIDIERRSTEGDVATRNLVGQTGELRRLIAQRGGDRLLESRLIDALLQHVSYLGSYDDFAEIDRLTGARVAAEPTNAAEWRRRADYLGAVHRFADAREALDQAEAHGAAEADLARARWVIDLALGEDPVALGEVAASRLAARASFRTHADHANALAAAGRFEEADAAYVSALASYRDVSAFPIAWVAFQRGVMWAERADRPDLALPLYREAVRRLPGYVVANVHLAELEVEAGETDTAVARLRRLVDEGVGDPEPGAVLAELLAESDPAEAQRLAARAEARYEVLLEQHREAFLDHGSEFFCGPGDDAARCLSMARENLELRPTPRAYQLVIEAAQSAEDPALACELARSCAAMRGRHPVLDATARRALLGCGSSTGLH